MRLLGSLQFDLFPSALLFPPSLKPKAHHFSFPRILSQSAAGTKMEDGAWGLGKLARDLRLGCAPVPFLPCTAPGTDLGLSSLSLAPSDPRYECAAATLSSADLQRARVGAGGCCSRALGAFPTPRPLLPPTPLSAPSRPESPPPPSDAPIPAPLPGDSGMISHRSELLSCLPWKPAPLHPHSRGATISVPRKAGVWRGLAGTRRAKPLCRPLGLAGSCLPGVSARPRGPYLLRLLRA